MQALLKQRPEDFRVDEVLGFEADGKGEHDLLLIEKTSCNSTWVASQLGRFAGVPGVAVSLAGLKDRHAVTTQWFSVQLPGRSCDWSGLQLPGVRILEQARHSRKLRRGCHAGNRFQIVLRELRGDLESLSARLLALREHWVPNAFGSQRFGRNQGNLGLVDKLAHGARLDRSLRAFALSAARAQIFNAVLAQRLAAPDWPQLRPGDLVQLDGRGSFFGPVTEIDDSLIERAGRLEIHATGPLWGRGALGTGAGVMLLEQSVAAGFPAAIKVLEQAGLRQERRALRLRVQDFEWSWLTPEQLELRFQLGRGGYATSVISHLLQSEHVLETEIEDEDP